MPTEPKTGAEMDQAQMVRVRYALHAADECISYDTDRDVIRVLKQRDELRAEVERLRAAVAELQQDVERLQHQRAEQMLVVEQLRAALEQMVDVFGPFANMGAGRPAIDQARKVLGRAERLRVSSTRPGAGAWIHRQAEIKAEVERLKAALRQILEDPDAHILDSHRDDGWAALGRPKAG